MNKIKLTIILTLFAALCTAAYGQVTVGSGNKPVNGALLDIKEFDPDDPNDPKPDNTTAKKGLLMPRVNLSKKDQLYPMFESTTTPGTANADYNDGTKKSDQDKKHTGLIVYNVAAVPTEGLDVGVHSWDGSQWVAVKSGSGAAGTYNFVDPIIYDSGSGNVYLQAGTTAGQVLKWDPSAAAGEGRWVAGTDANTTYTGTAPIAINGSYEISLNDGGVGLSKLTPGGTSGQVLTSNGTGSAPSWTAILPASATDGQVLKWNGTTSKWEAGPDANDNTTYTASSSILIDGVNKTLTRAALTGDVTASEGNNATTIAADAVTTAKIKDYNVTPVKIAGSATAGEVLTSNGDGTAKWAELKSSGGTQPTIPDNNKPVLEAGSGPWLVYYNAASYTGTAAFKFTGTAFVMCYAINNSATVGTNVESSTWMGVVTGTTSFLGRVDNRREYYVIYPATDLTVEYLLNVAAYPWYLFHM